MSEQKGWFSKALIFIITRDFKTQNFLVGISRLCDQLRSKYNVLSDHSAWIIGNLSSIQIL